MIYTQSVLLAFALMYTTTMIHNWVVALSTKLEFAPGSKLMYTPNMIASIFWGLFYLSCQF